MSVSTDGRTLFVLDLDGGTVTVLNLLLRQAIAQVPVGGGPIASTLTTDGAHLLVAELGAGEVAFIDTTTYAVSARVSVGSHPLCVTISGDRAYVTNGGDGTVSVLDTRTPGLLGTFPVPLHLPPIFVTATAALQIALPPGGQTAFVSQTTDLGDQFILAVVAVNSATAIIEHATPAAFGALEECHGRRPAGHERGRTDPRLLVSSDRFRTAQRSMREFTQQLAKSLNLCTDQSA